MNDYLFKLKKDGKTVGYLNFEGANPCYGFEIKFYAYGAYEFEQMLKKLYVSDIVLADLESHPFVTKDKNGKDVFAGDRIKGLYLWPDTNKTQIITGKVDWREETFNWVLYHTPNTPECAELWQLYDFELIEDKNE